MNGTSPSHTLAIDLIPPSITTAVSTAITRPVIHGAISKRFVYQRGNGVCLHHVSNTEGGYRGKGGKNYSEPFLFHPSLEDIHWTAGHQPLFRFYAVLNREERFGIFGGDAKDSGQPHPEHSAGTTGSDGRGNPDDVTRAVVAASAVVNAPNWLMSPRPSCDL
jgi:hypothetical protein